MQKVYDKLNQIVKVTRDRELTTLVKDLSKRVTTVKINRLKECLNRIYWQYSSLTHRHKDMVQELHKDLPKLLIAPTPPANPTNRRRELSRQLQEMKQRRNLLTSSESVMALNSDYVKTELIKLGHQHKDLRESIEVVLDTLEGSRSVEASGDSLESMHMQYMQALVKEIASKIKGRQLAPSKVNKERGGYMFAILRSRTEYLLEITVKLDSDMIEVKSDYNEYAKNMHLQLRPNLSVGHVANHIVSQMNNLV